jgi:amino acid transporter
MKKIIVIIFSVIISIFTIYIIINTNYNYYKSENISEIKWFYILGLIVINLILYAYSINLITRIFYKKYFLKKVLNRISRILSFIFIIVLLYLISTAFENNGIDWKMILKLIFGILIIIYIETYFWNSKKLENKNEIKNK